MLIFEKKYNLLLLLFLLLFTNFSIANNINKFECYFEEISLPIIIDGYTFDYFQNNADSLPKINYSIIKEQIITVDSISVFQKVDTNYVSFFPYAKVILSEKYTLFIYVRHYTFPEEWGYGDTSEVYFYGSLFENNVCKHTEILASRVCSFSKFDKNAISIIDKNLNILLFYYNDKKEDTLSLPELVKYSFIDTTHKGISYPRNCNESLFFNCKDVVLNSIYSENIKDNVFSNLNFDLSFFFDIKFLIPLTYIGYKGTPILSQYKGARFTTWNSYYLKMYELLDDERFVLYINKVNFSTAFIAYEVSYLIVDKSDRVIGNLNIARYLVYEDGNTELQNDGSILITNNKIKVFTKDYFRREYELKN